MKKNNPIGQHIVSKTYLKKFSIDPKSRRDKSIVECLRNHPIRTIERKSVNSNFFKEDDFYTTKSHKPYEIENLFGSKIEPTYNNIISEIENEEPIKIETLYELLYWIYLSKYRNTHYRDTIEQLIRFKLKWTQPDLLKNNEDDIVQFSKKKHLDIITEVSHFEKFCQGMLKKDFLFLAPYEEMQFITNDNPGFSINVIDSSPDFSSINVQFATNEKASNYYPLSPKLCLAIVQPEPDRNDQEDYLDILIARRDIDDRYMDFLNGAAFGLMRKYCVGNERKFLEPYLNMVQPPQLDTSALPIFRVGGRLVKESERRKPPYNTRYDVRLPSVVLRISFSVMQN